jgi:hypothetical protein
LISFVGLHTGTSNNTRFINRLQRNTATPRIMFGSNLQLMDTPNLSFTAFVLHLRFVK